ncbi:energy transducer TonB [Pseudoalteromonas sp. MMG010]|uniref:energy transducer TonB n=1 Tax=Pseudoalteromonas sp. MMG010 TaxID=2822685 RepID=UPI001B3A5F0C|nr:energy transducer TonB [Pseudoalteromonas sp. MMG010]MBQ4832766.1 energy transducer TonB [Pseudoalteromonas sp. MMG010]
MQPIISQPKNKRHPLFAFMLSLSVLAAALLLLWLGQLAENVIDDKVVVREVAMVALPPPPPPSVSQQQSSEPLPSLTIQGAGAAIQAVEIKVESNFKVTKPDVPNTVIAAPQWQSMSINWDAFSLNQLDTLPTPLSTVKARLPKSLTRHGTGAFIVKLDVFIDENGRLTLIEVLENPHPSLKPEIDRIIKTTRFTAPKKDGETVRTRFIWPIEFKP